MASGIATSRQLAWPATGTAAGAITGSYVDGRNVVVGDATELWLGFTLASTAPATTLLARVRWSPDGGVTFYDLPGLNFITSGVGDFDNFQADIPPADGNPGLGPIVIPAGTILRVALTATGGTAPTALVTAHLVSV